MVAGKAECVEVPCHWQCNDDGVAAPAAGATLVLSKCHSVPAARLAAPKTCEVCVLVALETCQVLWCNNVLGYMHTHKHV